MRIAYATIHVAPDIMQGGVGKKIKTQMGIWRTLGHETMLFSLTPAGIPFPDECSFIFDANTTLFKRELNRASALRRMLKAIQEYAPSIIYLRFGLYSYPLHQIFKIAPVVLEVNSNDIAEYTTRGQFFYWLNRNTRSLTFSNVCGIITPTQELASVYPLKKKQYVAVISNGIDLSTIESLPPTKNDRPVITLVGTPGMKWHGVDKLIELARLYPDICVNIVGDSSSDIVGSVPPNVTLHGFLDQQQIRDVFLKTDVACGTLALHRKNMYEACPLKVREALLYGLPLILAYKDPDLQNIELNTILNIPNTEDNVMQNAERIRKFAYDMIGKRVDIGSVAPYLDQRRKEKDRLSFFNLVLNNKYCR